MEIMEDVTPWSGTLPFFQGLGMVLLNVLLFTMISVLIFRSSLQRPLVSVEPASSPVSSYDADVKNGNGDSAQGEPAGFADDATSLSNGK